MTPHTRAGGRPATWLVTAWAAILALLSIGFVIYDPGETAVFVAPALMAVGMGALIVTRTKRNAVGVTMLVGGSGWLLYTIGGDYARVSLELAALPAGYLAGWLGSWTGPVFYLSLPTLLLLFPDGRVTGRRWLLGLVGLGAILIVAGAVSLWGVPLDVLVDDSALTREPRYVASDLAFIVGLWLTLPATVSIIRRYRKGDPLLRQQVKWLLFGAVGLAGSLSLAPILEDSAYWGIALAIGMSLFPVGVGVAVFRYRLYDLGRLVARTVTYTVVVAVLGAIFAIGVVYVPNQLMGAADSPPLLVAATTLLAAALFNPLRRRAQASVDRRFNRSHFDAARVMDGFAGSLRDQVETHEVIDGWIAVVSETMQPSAVAVWVRE